MQSLKGELQHKPNLSMFCGLSQIINAEVQFLRKKNFLKTFFPLSHS